MREQFKPRPYQHQIIGHILETPRCHIWAGMGTGKTISTLTALDILQLTDPGPALIVAPKRVAQSTWPDEVAKWAHLSDMTVSPVIGNLTQRKAALRVRADVYTINYENIPWLVEYFGKQWPFTKIVADESTKLKGFRLRQGGMRSRELARVAHAKANRFICLTGTPSPNGLQDLWGQSWFIDKGERLGYSFSAFENRWFQKIQIGEERFATQITPLPFAQEQIQDALRDVTITIDARDYFDIKAPIVNTIRVTLPKDAMALYRDMEREMFIALENGTSVEAVNAASKTMKCLQIANGAIFTDEKCSAFTEVHDVKLQALESIIEESAGMPVLVAYHFRHDLTRLQKHFPKGKVLDDDPKTISRWNEGKIPVLFAHPQSAGHGLNLQHGGNVLAFFGHWWNLEEYQQIIERIGPTRQAQSGYDRPVYIHHIVAKGTIDETVMARRETKREVQDLLLDAMKQRGEE